MGESIYSDDNPEQLYHCADDNSSSYGADTDVAGMVDSSADAFYTTGLVPDQDCLGPESVEILPTEQLPEDFLRTPPENPFVRRPIELPEGQAYMTVGQIITNWADSRPEDLLSERAFGAHYFEYFDAIHDIRRRLGEQQELLEPDTFGFSILQSLRSALHEADLGVDVMRMSNDQVVDYTRERARTKVFECEQRDAELQPIADKFRRRLIHAATKQHLPVDLPTALAKLDAVRIIYFDGVEAEGSFDLTTGLVRIGLTDDPDEQESRVFHELSHVVGGYEMVRNSRSDENVRATRFGLLTVSHHGQQLRWLGEAVTDKLSVLLQDEGVDYRQLSLKEVFDTKNANPHYRTDERVLRAVLNGPEGKVPFYDVIAAHTEDYDPRVPQGERSPKQRQLYKQMGRMWQGHEVIDPIIFGRHSAAFDRHEGYDISEMVRELVVTRFKVIVGRFNRP